MYEHYFNLAENPFTIAPNPRYFYLSEQHREALAHLQYGLNENGGFILLTGEVGTGKTTAWRCLVENLPTDVDLAIVLNPRITEIELLETICDELGIVYEQGSGIKNLSDKINQHLLDTYARHRRTVVIVEEAQNLSAEVLEQLRLLTNLETNESKLLQIILIGQPELSDKIAEPQLRQLRQRIIARFHLQPFGAEDVRAYIHHRLSVAGASPRLFSATAIRKLVKHSSGIPRLINLICDRALLGCYSEERGYVDANMVAKASAEVFGRSNTRTHKAASNTVVYRNNYAGPVVAVASAAAIATIAIFSLPSYFPILFNDNSRSGNMIAQPLNIVERGLDKIGIAEIMQPISDDSDSVDIAMNDVEQTDSHSSKDGTRNTAVYTMTQELSEPSKFATASIPWQNDLAVAARKQDPYRTLFNLWRIELPEMLQSSPCEYALQHQLDCWHRRGSINSLKRVNRPALLKMISSEGQLFYAVLKSIDKSDRLRLTVADKTIDIKQRELDDVWTGEYTLLWRRPQNYRDTIYPGDTDQTVGWLTEQLASLPDYGPPIPETSLYDYDLENRIRLLQKRCGLFVDGLVGKETLIKINTLTGTPPQLQRGENCSGVG